MGCRQIIAGGLLGALAGAVLGNNIATGGGRSGGSIIGGVAGAAVGAHVGKATAACGEDAPPPPRYEADYVPPPPPPPPRPRCGRAETRIEYPDGSVEEYPVRACRGSDGRFHVVEDFR